MGQLSACIYTFPKGNFLDGSRPSIALKDFSTFDCLRCNLWDEIVCIKDESLEQSRWWDDRGELDFIGEHTHHTMSRWPLWRKIKVWNYRRFELERRECYRVVLIDRTLLPTYSLYVEAVTTTLGETFTKIKVCYLFDFRRSTLKSYKMWVVDQISIITVNSTLGNFTIYISQPL